MAFVPLRETSRHQHAKHTGRRDKAVRSLWLACQGHDAHTKENGLRRCKREVWSFYGGLTYLRCPTF